jgi:KDO2-lipid IV(A) lauroyltransferase
MRVVGPWIPEHKIGRENLKAAFPEKSPAEIDAILAGVWENLGRVGAEFAHLDRMSVLNFEQGGTADVMYDRVAYERFVEIRNSGKPVLCFAAHLANWEAPALAPKLYGVKSNLLYRRPNIGAVSDAVIAMRAGCMGKLIATSLSAPVQLSNALERGEHVGMLVDQHFGKGVDVLFFGRWAKTNPLIAQLARHTECAIRGVRVVRQPDGNTFFGELTEEIRGQDRHQGHDAGDHRHRGRLGARASGAVVVAAQKVEMSLRPSFETAAARPPQDEDLMVRSTP